MLPSENAISQGLLRDISSLHWSAHACTWGIFFFTWGILINYTVHAAWFLASFSNRGAGGDGGGVVWEEGAVM